MKIKKLFDRTLVLYLVIGVLNFIFCTALMFFLFNVCGFSEHIAPLVNYGDVNSDGALSLIDVILVLRRASQYTDSIDIAAADLNGDETVDLRDSLCALRKMLNG